MQSQEMKSYPMFIKSIEDRVVKQVFSVFGVIDMFRDRIRKGAFKKTLSERMQKIRILWQHNHRNPPVATLLDAFEIGKRDLPDEIREKFPEATGGLEGVSEYLDTPRGNEVLAGIKTGAINENSIGYDSIQSKYIEEEVSEGVTIRIRELIEIRLWDLSPVNWGANPATFNLKAVPFKAAGIVDGEWHEPSLKDFFTGTTPEWDSLSDDGKHQIADHFAWAASMPPNEFEDLELPHHSPQKSDVGPANWDGVRSAMSHLMQAGVRVEDRRAVYNHLAEHYKEKGEEPPNFKLVELAYSVREAMTLSQTELVLCYQELETLSKRMTEAEPLIVAMDKRRARAHFDLMQLRVQALKHSVEIN